jgi:hypothetical protein
MGASFGAGFSLELCESGLRVRLLPVFSAVCRPFLVPWDDLQIEELNSFLPLTNVYLGRPAVGTLAVSSRLVRQFALARQRAAI